MKNTKLLLIEGIPGSGKSTLAQFLAYTLIGHGIPCQWCYEEEKEHPLYIFHDQSSLQNTIETLASGHYQQVIDAVLEQWKAFVQYIQSSEKVVILDGCLFGYLTWSLFPLDIPAEEIQVYLSRVEQLIQPLQPCLIYLYQQELAQALEKICKRRGNNTLLHFIAQAIESPYGKRRNLQGFSGVVTYWQTFRSLIEDALSHFTLSTLALENSSGDWPLYEHLVLDFLDLPVEKPLAIAPALLEPFVGIYIFEKDGNEQSCLILFENGSLSVDGMPHVWPRTRLILQAHNVFAIESLPFLICFEEDKRGAITGMRVSGPELLFGNVDSFFTRTQK